MRHIDRSLIYLFAAVCLASPLSAQDSSGGSGEAGEICELKDSSEIISIAICPKGLAEEELAKSGTAICDGRLPCAVWFWTNESDMPEAAPAMHDDLTPDQIRAAQAVWTEETKSLISIEKVSKGN